MANGESGELLLERRLAGGASYKLLGRMVRTTRQLLSFLATYPEVK